MARVVDVERPPRTKADVLASLQCTRRAWLSVHAPAEATPLSASRRALRDAGRDVTRLARALFPTAVAVVDEDFAAAAARTAALLASDAPAILDAAVAHAGVAVRPAVLEHLADGGWRLVAIRSGTRVRDVHLDDLAVQREVLAGAGLSIGAVELVHVDPEYVRGDDVDLVRLFTRHDVTADVEEHAEAVRVRLAALEGELAAPTPPAVEPSPHCSTPYRCEFWAYCTRAKPSDWILHFRYVPAEQWTAMVDGGTTRLGDLSDASTTPPMLRRMRDAHATEQPVVTADLAAALAELGPATDYLDFETISPAVPLYPAAHPYERVPLQWSLHRRDGAGGIAHFEFLADGRDDPRRAFAESLLATAEESTYPILVYSAFEDEVLAELADALPDLASRIAALRARLRDVLPIVREHVYHPDFRGSFSLKAVAPALVPAFGWGDLPSIADGADATVQLARLAAGACDAEEAATLRAHLRAYCARDTEALLRVHDALRALAHIE